MSRWPQRKLPRNRHSGCQRTTATQQALKRQLINGEGVREYRRMWRRCLNWRREALRVRLPMALENRKLAFIEPNPHAQGTAASMLLTVGERRFEGSFCLPSLDTFRTLAA
jgi:hypothetical protein